LKATVPPWKCTNTMSKKHSEAGTRNSELREKYWKWTDEQERAWKKQLVTAKVYAKSHPKGSITSKDFVDVTSFVVAKVKFIPFKASF